MIYNGTKHRTNAKSVPAKSVGVVQLGYEDAKAGRGYHKDYDTWERVCQINYEKARLYVTVFLAAGRPVPPLDAESPFSFQVFRAQWRAAYATLPNPDLSLTGVRVDAA